MTRRPVVGVVLTGGASRRMGTDKAALVVDGTPMVLRVLHAMQAAGCSVVEAQGGDRVALEALDVTVFDDASPGDGPVSAIADVLARHRDHEVVIAACDLPWLDGHTVATVIDAGRSAASSCAVAAVTGDRQLLAWFAAGASGHTQRSVEAGVRSFNRLMASLDAVAVEVAAVPVRNVNTPSDLDVRR